MEKRAWLGGDVVTDGNEVAGYRRLCEIAMKTARPLSEYLASLRRLPIPAAALIAAQKATSA